MLNWFSKHQPRSDKDRRAPTFDNEVTPLTFILPSAASTSNPSLANITDYGAAKLIRHEKEEDDRSVGSLELFTPLHPDDSFDFDTGVDKRTSLFRLFHGRLFIGLSIVVMAFMAFVAIHGRSAVAITPRNPSKSPSGDATATQDSTKANSKFSHHKPLPFSLLDPVKDLGLNFISHGEATAPPHDIFRQNQSEALPTCAWYQNLIMNRGEPGSLQRVYTSPLVVDLNGPIPGIRLHPNHVGSSVTVMQLSYEDQNGITIGISKALSTNTISSKENLSNRYSVLSSTPLGITLEWVRIYFCTLCKCL